MFDWLKAWIATWAEHSLKREIEQLHAENLNLKAETLTATGEEWIQLTLEERQKLDELRTGIDPDVLRRIDVLSDAE